MSSNHHTLLVMFGLQTRENNRSEVGLKSDRTDYFVLMSKDIIMSLCLRIWGFLGFIY